ncbi:MAG: hypothetical protein H0V70_01560 [Ktedonobacteraceae bacterium]|nr:hypothetical protein [Ktedonobacteraceae bacterium]
MSEDKKQTQQAEKFGISLLLNGKPATQQEAARILRAPALASDPDERATKPIAQVDRGFKLMR